MNKTLQNIVFGLTIIVFIVIVFNAFQINKSGAVKIQPATAAVLQIPASNTDTKVVKEINMEDIDIAPKGMPEIYGQELSVSFDDISSVNPEKANTAISKLGALDEQISLSGKDLDRYISIAGKISCEYCCGAESIIFKNGNAACGCAHSYAMRGLAKYLIKNHPKEFGDDEILEELGKWKTLFFPSPIIQKAKVLKNKGIELNYINLASNKYRGIENK